MIDTLNQAAAGASTHNPAFRRKAAGTPLVIGSSGICRLERMPLEKGEYSEEWLQQVAFDYPDLLPVTAIEPGFGEIVAVAREVPCAHGYIDNLYITASGDLVLVEAKLWRNPQARREVVAQALDYVAALSTMSYEQFEVACRKGAGLIAANLYELVKSSAEAVTEAEFVDAVSRNLRRGRMLVIALGDGIRSEAEALATLLQSHAGAHFTFALVELATWRNPETGEITALPSTLAQTVMISRGIVTLEAGTSVQAAPAAAPEPRPSTITEELYYEELAKRDPAYPGAVRAFVALLEPLGIYPDFKASLNLKAELPGYAKSINFGYLTKTGKVWTEPLSLTDPVVALAYNTALADLIGGSVATTSGGQTYVSTNGSAGPRIADFLPQHAQAWANAISGALQTLRKNAAAADA